MVRFALLFLLISSVASAQTAQWTAPSNAPTTAVAQALEYRLYLNGTAQVLTSVSCTGTAPAIACQAPVPAPQMPSVNVLGARWELTARDVVNGTAESPKTVPFFPAPAVPSALSVRP
jgi:hypothetical protein